MKVCAIEVFPHGSQDHYQHSSIKSAVAHFRESLDALYTGPSSDGSYPSLLLFDQCADGHQHHETSDAFRLYDVTDDGKVREGCL